MELIAYLAALLFLPLFPAFILYKLLPSRATVAGPFRGLNLNLSGAFAGYFLLVLLTSFILREQLKREYEMTTRGEIQVWRVTGKVTTPKRFEDFRNKDVVRYWPRPIEVFSDGTFTMDIIVKRDA